MLGAPSQAGTTGQGVVRGMARITEAEPARLGESPAAGLVSRGWLRAWREVS